MEVSINQIINLNAVCLLTQRKNLPEAFRKRALTITRSRTSRVIEMSRTALVYDFSVPSVVHIFDRPNAATDILCDISCNTPVAQLLRVCNALSVWICPDQMINRPSISQMLTNGSLKYIWNQVMKGGKNSQLDRLTTWTVHDDNNKNYQFHEAHLCGLIHMPQFISMIFLELPSATHLVQNFKPINIIKLECMTFLNRTPVKNLNCTVCISQTSVLQNKFQSDC